MSRRSESFDFHRARIVLGEGPLYGIEVVLAHVGQTAPFVVPVSAVGSAETVWVKRSKRRWSAVHVPVESVRYGFGLRIHHPAPLSDLQSAPLDMHRLAGFEQTALHNLVGQDVSLVRATSEPAECADL